MLKWAVAQGGSCSRTALRGVLLLSSVRHAAHEAELSREHPRLGRLKGARSLRGKRSRSERSWQKWPLHWQTMFGRCSGIKRIWADEPFAASLHCCAASPPDRADGPAVRPSSYGPVSHEAPQAPTVIAATNTAASSSHHRAGRGVCQRSRRLGLIAFCRTPSSELDLFVVADLRPV